MTSSDDEKIEEFKKLIKDKGSKEASKELETLGISYPKDFTEEHVTDPIFSDPLTKEMLNKSTINPIEFKTDLFGTLQNVRINREASEIITPAESTRLQFLHLASQSSTGEMSEVKLKETKNVLGSS